MLDHDLSQWQEKSAKHIQQIIFIIYIFWYKCVKLGCPYCPIWVITCSCLCLGTLIMSSSIWLEIIINGMGSGWHWVNGQLFKISAFIIKRTVWTGFRWADALISALSVILNIWFVSVVYGFLFFAFLFMYIKYYGWSQLSIKLLVNSFSCRLDWKS